MYCLDTNICIYLLKGTFPSIADRLRGVEPGEVAVAAMVKAELLFGAEKSQQSARTRARIEEFLEPLAILPFDDRASALHARLRASLERRGTPVGCEDLVIASTALAHDAILVTHNTREFKRIPGLSVEDWTQP